MVVLCVGSEEGRWEEGAEGPLVLMFTDDGSGFGVEETDDAEKKVKRTSKRTSGILSDQKNKQYFDLYFTIKM